MLRALSKQIFGPEKGYHSFEYETSFENIFDIFVGSGKRMRTLPYLGLSLKRALTYRGDTSSCRGINGEVSKLIPRSNPLIHR